MTTPTPPESQGLLERGPHPGRGLYFEGQRYAYEGLWRCAAAWSETLRSLGMRPGDRVVYLGGSQPAALVALLGSLMAELIHIPVNERYPQGEIEHILRDSGARLAIVDADADAILAQLRSAGGPSPIPVAAGSLLDNQTELPEATPDSNAPALMIYTSGTTGRSKGVLHSRGGVDAAIGALIDAWAFGPQDRLSLHLPLFHVHGLLLGLWGCSSRGADILLHRRFEADAVLRDFGERRATAFMGVPTMYHRLVEALDKSPDKASPLREARLFCSGSAALAPQLFERFETHTGHRVLERYGMSETLLTLSNPYDGERVPGHVGFAVPGFEARVCDEDGAPVSESQDGELQVRGKGVMLRYWERPDATTKAFDKEGWFRTGDCVRFDPQRGYRIVGRMSVDILKTGGFKVSAREVEECLSTVEGLAEIAVVGRPDEVWGQRVEAAIVPKEGVAVEALLRELQSRAELELAEYKRPRAYALRSELPRNALGKLQKKKIFESDAG